jgi:hypothetical protein
MVVDSGLRRSPAIPEIREDLPIAGVIFEKLGITVVTAWDEFDLAGAEGAEGAAGVEGADGVDPAGADAAGTVVSIPDAVSINFLPAAAVMFFIITRPLTLLVETSVSPTLPTKPAGSRWPSKYV